MKQGLYSSLPFETYKKLPFLNNSLASEMLRSPAHCFYKMTHKGRTTEAQRLGRNVHSLLLDKKPTLIAKPTRQYGRDFLSASDLKKGDDPIARKIAESVRGNKVAASILQSATHKEATIVWEHATGQMLKARLDVLDLKKNYFADVKTTRDASAEAFRRDLYKYGYHRQGAMYRAAMESLGVRCDGMIAIVVETIAPYAVALYEIEPETLDLGWRQLEPLIEQFAHCKAENDFPGYDTAPQRLTLPGWAIKQIEEQADSYQPEQPEGF